MQAKEDIELSKNPTKGGYRGVFGNLTIYVVIGLDPDGNNDCLTRVKGGLFVWSEAMLNKLGEDDLPAKQITLVYYMLQLMYNLLLKNENIDLYDVPFRPFIGRTLNLQKS